jgi:benzoate-CoA ligase
MDSAPVAPAFEPYNAADALLTNNLVHGNAQRTAIIDAAGSYSYAEVARRANRFANVLQRSGIETEQRVLLCLHDSVDFPVCFLGAIKAGVVPVPVNTLLTPQDYAYMLRDSRARALVVSAPLLDCFRPILGLARHLKKIWIAGAGGMQEFESLETAMEMAGDSHVSADTRADDVAFWLYTSGTTGLPKAAMHVHTSLAETARRYGQGVLGIRAGDVVFSAPKLFFAYGLGNGLTFPFSVGATSVLLADRPTPEAVLATMLKHRPSIFFGVPTLYAMMLNKDLLPNRGAGPLRLCVSAGEALPETLFQRWLQRTGVEIVEGIGATETLHTFMSNRPGNARPGTSGQPVEGYEVSLLDEYGRPVANGEVGDLYVKAPSSAVGYWNQRELSRQTFRGEWLRTGDKFMCSADGFFRHCGRADDLLKVGGIYVAPAEVENALLAHAAVAEAAVVGSRDADGLIKPRAFVVPTLGVAPSGALEHDLITHVCAHLAEYKRPRWIEFIDELPKTATGKIQRFKLRQLHA